MSWLSDITVFYSHFEGAFTKFVVNGILLPVLLDLDTCNASAPENHPPLSCTKAGDAAG